MKPVGIIGAGITGLTAAFYLQRKGIPVVVYESSSQPGGVIRSVRQDGYLAEFGPNTLLETSPVIRQLVVDAGLESRRLDPAPEASARYVVHNKRPVAMPDSPLQFMTSGLFSPSAKLAVLREPFIPPRRDGAEETIAEFVVRRFNQEFLDNAIDALVGGIYAGNPQKLSVTHAFPKLKALEDNYGSMIKGQIFGGRERKRRGEVAKDRAPKFSFDKGLQVLPDTLCELLGDAVRLNTTVVGLALATDGWTVRARHENDEQTTAHSAVIYAGTAYRLAELPVQINRSGVKSSGQVSGVQFTAGGQLLNLAAFLEIRYPPVASVVLGFRREDVTHPCEGFGMLIPKVEGFKILGTIFSSSLFPNRAPAGHLTLTSYVGGERYPELASLPPEKLFELTCTDLRVLLGVKGEPTFQHCVLYPKAIPQYNLGYGKYRELLKDIESFAPGIFFAGHYRDGISVSDSIVSGCNNADRVAEFISTGQKA